MNPFFRPYKYKKPRPQRIGVPAYSNQAEDEGLTGFVMGKDASNLEERFARALNRNNLDFIFQYEVETAQTVPGQEKEVDFMVSDPPQPWEVDGNFTHKSAEQQGYDRDRDAQIDAAMSPYGFLPVQRVTERDLGDQDHANAFVGNYIA